MNTTIEEPRVKKSYLVARVVVVVALVVIGSLLYSTLRERFFRPQERVFMQRSLYAEHTWSNAPKDFLVIFSGLLPLLVSVGGYVLYVRQLEPRLFGLPRAAS